MPPFSSILLLASLYPFLAPTQTFAQQLCNGHPSLCARPYSNITFIGAHDSAFVGSSPADNQGISVTAQLDSGIRFLQSQAHVNSFGTLSLCHTSCFLNDAGPLERFLREVKGWMEREGNENEVVTLLVGNGDRTDIGVYDAAFKAAGLDTVAFVPETQRPLEMEAWPTLGELITAERRLVVFMDYITGDGKKVPYILDEFEYFFETPYNTLDPGFEQCSIDRPPGAKSEGRMYIVNHFLDKKILDKGEGEGIIPKGALEQGKGLVGDVVGGLKGGIFGRKNRISNGSYSNGLRRRQRKGDEKSFGRFGKRDDILIPERDKASKTNSVDGGEGSIGRQVSRCEGLHGRRPGVVLLDFVDEGEGVQAGRVLNGL
ncbi:MAG: hypothetical protein Q9169_006253 [Polycauliona sp. 2 TL-2023]